MHPDLLLDHLAIAERHIASDRKKITEQITFIAWLNWLRKDATGAKALLREFEMRFAAHITDRERLRAKLRVLRLGRVIARAKGTRWADGDRNPAASCSSSLKPRTY